MTPSHAATAAWRHDAWLDGLRAIAALMVFMHHASPGTRGGGWDVGVLVFFSLSGYLMYKPFLAGGVDLRAYAIRRLLRIVPAYLVASVGVAALMGYRTDAADVLTMTRPVIVVAWTLKIEILFYVALPIIAWLARGRREPLLALAILSLALALVQMVSQHTVPNEFAGWAWAFVPGMLVAHLEARQPAVLQRAGSAGIVAAGIALIALSVVPDIVFPDVPGAVGSALVLAWLLRRRAPGPRVAAAMAVGAALSYSFYLWHEPILDAVGRGNGLAGVALALVLTAVIAGAIYVAVERPCIEVGRRLARIGRRATGAVVAPA